MNYERAKKLKPDEFKRLCGVSPQIFNQMVKIVENHEKSKKKIGRPSKLTRLRSSFDNLVQSFTSIPLKDYLK